MYLPGHLGLGLLAGAVIVALGPRRRTAIAACAPVVLASAPDIDRYLAGIPHRGITHTVWAVGGLGLGLAVVAGLWTRRRGTERTADVTLAFAAGVVAGSVHLLGDVVTPMGIQPFYPLLSGSYSLDLVAARNPDVNLALLCAGCVAFGLVLVRERAAWTPALRARLHARRLRLDGDRPVRVSGRCWRECGRETVCESAPSRVTRYRERAEHVDASDIGASDVDPP